MAGRPKKIDDNKVFDISRPNKAKPLATSRPVITKISDEVTDSMINSSLLDDKSEEKTILSAPSLSKRVIKPIKERQDEKQDKDSITVLSAPVLPDESEDDIHSDGEHIKGDSLVTSEVDEANTKNEDTTSAVEDPAVQTDDEAPSQNNDSTNYVQMEDDKSNEETATVDAVIDQTSKKKDNKLNPDIDLAVRDLIESKKYFVPLSHDSGKRNHRLGLWVFLLIVLLLAALYLAVDADVMDVGFTLPFEIIK